MALILWSGGLDSSLVLTWCLQNWFGGQRGWEDFELTSRPRTLTIECSQIHEGLQKKQEQAREKLKKKFKRKGWEFDHKTIKIDSGGVYDGGLPQPILWLSQAALAIDRNEQLYLGWIRGDDATANLYQLKQAWKVLTELNDRENSPMLLPLQYVKKYDVIEGCKKEKIFNSCWWCENPTSAGRRCGRCECCLAMVAAEAVLERKKKDKDKSLTELCTELADKIKGS